MSWEFILALCMGIVIGSLVTCIYRNKTVPKPGGSIYITQDEENQWIAGFKFDAQELDDLLKHKKLIFKIERK